MAAVKALGFSGLVGGRLQSNVPRNKLFHIMRNSRQRGTGAGAPGLEGLSRCLPPSWRVLLPGSRSASLGLRAPDGSTGRLAVVRRARLEPRDVLMLRASSQNDLQGTLVTAPFLSPRTRELLAESGASYADDSGNLRIVVDKPGLFLETQGAIKDPGREPRPLASLKGPAAARVVRALCDVKPPYGVRKLAEIASTPPASVSRVVSLLRREALVESGSRGEVLSVDWAALIKRWTQDYQFVSSNEVTTYLDPRGVPSLLQKLARMRGGFVVTGSVAASRRAPIAAVRLAAIYVEEPAEAAEALGLRVAEAGGNVMLVRPLDGVAFERTSTEDGVEYAALSHVAADLLTSPGRAPAEGEELLEWMKKNTDAWRA